MRDWSLCREAIIWVHDRNENRINDPKFQVPSLTAWKLYPTLESNDEKWYLSGERLLESLKSGDLQGRFLVEGSPSFIDAGFWNRMTVSELQNCNREVFVLSACVKTLFPCSERLSHDEVVDWCLHWIAAGHGQGMDKAWTAFKADPAHVGLSRDDVFRPAWREAKTR